MQEKKKRGVKGLNITKLPYEVKVYMNNQVLIPAQLIRSLGLTDATYSRIKFKYRDKTFEIEVKLLRTKYTDSRQFTIPKEIRTKIGLLPGNTIKILDIQKIK